MWCIDNNLHVIKTNTIFSSFLSDNNQLTKKNSDKNLTNKLSGNNFSQIDSNSSSSKLFDFTYTPKTTHKQGITANIQSPSYITTLGKRIGSGASNKNMEDNVGSEQLSYYGSGIGSNSNTLIH